MFELPEKIIKMCSFKSSRERDLLKPIVDDVHYNHYLKDGWISFEAVARTTMHSLDRWQLDNINELACGFAESCMAHALKRIKDEYVKEHFIEVSMGP